MRLRLREWRERRGLSVRQLADQAGVGFATVHRIEMERMSPTIAMLEKLAKALRINVGDFLPPRRRQPKRRG